MAVYIIGTSISVLFAHLASAQTIHGKRLSKGYSWLFEFLAIMPLALISGLRVNVGTDYLSYASAYEHPVIYSEHFGKGFMLLIYALREISKNPRIFFIATSIIICAPYVHIAIKESEGAAFSVLFFVISEDYFVSMNAISQFMAMPFIWVAAEALQKKQFPKAVIMCLIALLFHGSSICFFIFLLFYISPLSTKKMTALVITMCGACIVFRKQLISLIVKFTIYGDYFSSTYASTQMSVALPLTLIYVVMFISMALMTGLNEMDKNPRCRMFILSVLMCASVMILSYFLTGNTYRLTYYFTGIIGLCFPSILKEIRKEKDRYVVKAAVIVLFTIWTTMLITHNNHNVLPYYWIL